MSLGPGSESSTPATLLGGGGFAVVDLSIKNQSGGITTGTPTVVENFGKKKGVPLGKLFYSGFHNVQKCSDELDRSEGGGTCNDTALYGKNKYKISNNCRDILISLEDTTQKSKNVYKISKIKNKRLLESGAERISKSVVQTMETPPSHGVFFLRGGGVALSLSSTLPHTHSHFYQNHHAFYTSMI